MKMVAFIMAMMVLVLSCVPCMDEACDMKADKDQTVLVKNAGQQEQDHDDACSPFCHCSCCAGFSIAHTLPAITAVVAESSPVYSSSYIGSVIEISLPVWQPPQLTA